MRTASISLTTYNREVYEPSDDTFLLVDALLKASSQWPKRPYLCIEIGCGSGFASCALALILCQLGLPHHLIALDISKDAVTATRATLKAHGVISADVVQDRFQDFLSRTEQQYDIVVFNPPYVPTPDEELQRTDIARSWAGGWKGRIVIDQFLSYVPKILAQEGQLFLVVVSENDPPGILKALEELDSSLSGQVLMTRRADEELLSVLHIQRR
ncbi:hypothetical protein WJX74_007595 [Apatococcus lobatus]|uniref:Methyltransferase domain-containing protein n=1 Tax=Apatococcus lobatus TaxID=904363 RepID=A0AAW1R1N0_9CHLO